MPSIKAVNRMRFNQFIWLKNEFQDLAALLKMQFPKNFPKSGSQMSLKNNNKKFFVIKIVP